MTTVAGPCTEDITTAPLHELRAIYLDFACVRLNGPILRIRVIAAPARSRKEKSLRSLRRRIQSNLQRTNTAPHKLAAVGINYRDPVALQNRSCNTRGKHSS